MDLALSRATRAHADLEVAMFRGDQQRLRGHLRGWHFDYFDRGQRRTWAEREILHLPVHELHAISPCGQRLEILLNERDGADWVYRRDGRVRRPMGQAIRICPEGIPMLAIEIVLLYKSKHPRPRDERDFLAAREVLDVEARAWLKAALRLFSPGHAWEGQL